MKNKKLFSVFSLFLSAFVFFSCVDLDSEKTDLEYGSISLNAERAVYVSELKSARAEVFGFDSNGEKFVISAGPVQISGGKGSFDEIKNIPVSKNVVVKIQAYYDSAANSKIDGITMYGICDILPGKTVPVTINWESSKKGIVYAALLEAGVNLNALTSDQISSIDNSIPDVKNGLINFSDIAADFIGGTLKDSSKYVLEAGTVKVLSDVLEGCYVQVCDPCSDILQISEDNVTEVSVSDVAPGTWNVYAVKKGQIIAKGSVTVISGETKTVSLKTIETEFDGIKVLVEKSLGYPMIHYWECSDKVNYPATSWPGIAMNDEESETDYVYTFEGVSSVNILITNSSGGKLCSSNMALSEKGIYRITQSGAELQKAPEPPVVTVSSKAYLGGSFYINVQSELVLTEDLVYINGILCNLKIGSNKINVSDYTNVETTLKITGKIANEAGDFNIDFSVKVDPKSAIKIVSDPNELRIYQVMVASFQDGDPSIGYTQMWGPNNQLKGGDLQGIIDAVPYIKELGCNAIWMTPIFNSNGDSKLDATGYFAYDYFNIDPKFGTMEKFDELVEVCHDEGIAVILDGVFGHNKGTVAPSPNRTGIKNPGITPDTVNPVNYATNPNSIKYYSDVASYWITEHKIDGWRFDQCYQVSLGENAKGTTSDNCNTGGHNYWYDIRKVVEEAASSNGTKGVDWGTLGYMVGEHWRGDASLIQKGTVASGNAAGYGLNSCFDFPSYYQVVQAFAQEYNSPSKSTENITTGLSYLYQTYDEKGYSCKEDDGTYETYYPNFMLTNHDLFRIGDLINQKYSDGFDSDDYAKRNMVLLAAQAAYSGPITIYYGDEIADHNATTTSGWGADNVARSTGKISGFSAREQKVHDWTQKCLYARAAHKALWSGTNEKIIGEKDFYVAKKVGGGETIYIAFNYNSSSSKSFNISGSGEDLISGETFTDSVTVPPLSAMYVLVE